MILDNQGRLLGKVNLLDLVVLFFLMSLAGTVWYTIRVSHHRTLEVFSVEPRHIEGGEGKYLMINGTGFDGGTTIRLGNYPDRGHVYLDESTIGMEIERDIDPGLYRVIVRDGHGRIVTLPDAVEVIWKPKISEVKPRILYNTGEGTRIEIFGKLFTNPCSVRVGDRELDVVSTLSTERIEARLVENAPLPLGEQAVTVINARGQSTTLERAVTVLTAPEVYSVIPSQSIPNGQTVDLFIQGNHLREGTLFWIADHFLGEATYLNPQSLQIRVKATAELSEKALTLELPNGPKIVVLRDALEIRASIPVNMVVELLLDRKSKDTVQSLQQLPPWQLMRSRQQRKWRFPWPRPHFDVRVVVPASMSAGEGTHECSYAGQVLRRGHTIDVNVNGQKLSGVIATVPYSILNDDLMKNRKR